MGNLTDAATSVAVELQDRIQSTNALIAEHERAAADGGPPCSLLANIRALEKLKRRLESELGHALAESDVARERSLVRQALAEAEGRK